MVSRQKVPRYERHDFRPGNYGGRPGIEEYEYHRLNSNFPVQNRLIHVRPACNLRYDTMQQELPKLTEEVARLVNMYPGENTLVHAVSNISVTIW